MVLSNLISASPIFCVIDFSTIFGCRIFSKLIKINFLAYSDSASYFFQRRNCAFVSLLLFDYNSARGLKALFIKKKTLNKQRICKIIFKVASILDPTLRLSSRSNSFFFLKVSLSCTHYLNLSLFSSNFFYLISTFFYLKIKLI